MANKKKKADDALVRQENQDPIPMMIGPWVEVTKTR